MKTKLFTLLTVLGLISTTYAGEPVDEAKSVTAVFKKDKLIEVAFLSIKPDKANKLQNEYFKKVMPIAKEYGLKPLARIKVEYTYSEYVQPDVIGFFEWESKEKHEAFLKDPRFLKIKPVRDEALSFLRLGYFSVDKDTKVTFKSGDLIEVFSMWLNPESAHRMQTYFKNVMPLITGDKNEYDVKFPLALTSVNYGADAYKPERMGVAIWKSKKSNDKFFGSRAYRKIKADKEAAIKKLDVWQGQVVVQ